MHKDDLVYILHICSEKLTAEKAANTHLIVKVKLVVILYNGLCHLFSETIPLSPPLVPPSLTPLVSSDYFYTVKFPTINVTAQHKPNSWVSFLFKVQDTQENITRYYWQVLYITIILTHFILIVFIID